MSEPGHPRRCVIVAVDIERYSPRDNLRQYHAQQLFQEVMTAAVADAGLDRERWTRQQSGDGELAILPAETSEVTVLAGFVPALERILREHNRSLRPEAKVRLRVAMHQGLVHLTGANGFPGEAVVEACRLLDADPLRQALTRFPSASVALIVSRSIFQDVVRHRYDGLRPERFARVPIAVKQLETEAWIYVPDEDVNGVPWERPDNPTPDQPPKPRSSGGGSRSEYHISNNTNHGQLVIGTGSTVYGSWPPGVAR